MVDNSLLCSISTEESKHPLYDQYKNPNPMKTYMLGVHRIEIEERYEMKESIAQGAFGFIFTVKDSQSKSENEEENILAIKQITKPFEHKVFARRTLRELKLLRLLKNDNIIGIKQVLLPRSRDSFEEIYILNEFMPYDLNEILRSQELLSDEHHRFLLYQLLRGLKYIHSANIIHRDLKPKNLLVNLDCQLKICDFGSAKPVMPNLKVKQKQYTDYVTTRWYRAPELLLSWNQYTTAVDMWSVGCILAELLKRRPFFPGSETRSQVELIFEYIGTPSEEEIEQIPNGMWKKLVKSLPKRKKKDFETLFPDANPLALDLLKKLLVFNPENRISAKEALTHPYFEDFHEPEDEVLKKIDLNYYKTYKTSKKPDCEPISILEFEYESLYLTKDQLIDLTYEEILLYHFPEFLEKHNELIKNKKSIVEHLLQGECVKTDPFDSEEDEFGEEEEIIGKTAPQDKSHAEDDTTLLFKKETKKEEQKQNV